MKTNSNMPGPIGRVVRILAGIVFLALCFKTLTGYASFLGLDLPGRTWWIAAATSFYLLPVVVNTGLNRYWGRWPQAVVFLLVCTAVAFDFFLYESLWGPPLGLLVYLLVVFVLGALGLAFILAGILAVPG
jgi:hypothetical protein